MSGTTDHAPLTSYMHHFISGTKIPHSLLNAQQITSPLHMLIYISPYNFIWSRLCTLPLPTRVYHPFLFFFVFYHPLFFSLSFMFYAASCILFFLSIYFMDMFLVGVDQDPTRQPMTMDWQT